MSPTLITYIAFTVAVLILIWGAVELIKRYRRTSSKKINTPKTMLTGNWVTLKPSITNTDPQDPSLLTADDEHEETPEADLQTRAQQNGHYSESKKLL